MAPRPTGDPPDPDPEAPPKTPAQPTHFVLQNKVFSVAGSYFAIADDTQVPTFYVPLGDVQGVLSLPQLISGFDIKPGSADATVLRIVEKALAYVQRIHPGDSIPSELLDGTASWAVDDRHRVVAESRLRVQLVTWLAGKEAEVHDLTEILHLAEQPAIRGRVQEAAAAVAERLGFGRARKTEILDRLDSLARELSYIEALRDRLAAIRTAALKLAQLGDIYRAERGLAQEIGRVVILIRKPIGEYEAQFRLIDAQTAGILDLLREYQIRLGAIRHTRDDLHRRFMIWDDVIPRWQGLAVEMGPAAETLMRATYRLIVRNFPQDTTWPLQFGHLGKTRP